MYVCVIGWPKNERDEKMRLDKINYINVSEKTIERKSFSLVINLRTCQFDSNMYSIENL